MTQRFQYQPLAAPFNPPTAEAAPELSWQPQYPDRIPSRQPLPVYDLTGYAYVPAIDAWGIDGGQIPWLARYPDLLLPAPRVPESYSVLTREPDVIDLATFGWRGHYPDRVPAAEPLRLEGYAYTPAVDAWGIDDGRVPWIPEYPDFPARPRAPLNAESLTTLAYVPATTRWGIDKGEPPWAFYETRLSAWALPRATEDALAWIAYVPAVDRWGIDGGQIPWLPIFETRLSAWTAPRVTALHGYAQVINPAIFGIDGGQIPWRPTYPDMISQVRIHGEAPSFFWVGTATLPPVISANPPIIIGPFGSFPDKFELWYPAPVKPGP